MSTIINKNDNTVGNRTSATRGVRNESLEFVSDLSKYKVHHDDTDIRNWKIKDIAGNTIGEVEGLLADVNSKLVRYAEVEIDDDVIERHTGGRYEVSDKHALIPIGVVKVNHSDKSVNLHGLNIDHFVDYPRYNRTAVGHTTSYEIDTNNYLSGFHEYGNDYRRDFYSTDDYRSRNKLDDDFYMTGFYTGRV